MKEVVRLIIKITAVLISIVLLSILGYYCFYKWRESRQYADALIVKAFYMQSACGECSIDMKVEAVNNKDYKFLIGRDIIPKSRNTEPDELCNYIGDKRYQETISPASSLRKSFILVGYLHKYPARFPILGCSDAAYFTVEKIKHGDNGTWVKF